MVPDGVMNVKIHGTSMLQKSPTYYQTQRIGAFICDGVAKIHSREICCKHRRRILFYNVICTTIVYNPDVKVRAMDIPVSINI